MFQILWCKNFTCLALSLMTQLDFDSSSCKKILLKQDCGNWEFRNKPLPHPVKPSVGVAVWTPVKLPMLPDHWPSVCILSAPLFQCVASKVTSLYFPNKWMGQTSFCLKATAQCFCVIDFFHVSGLSAHAPDQVVGTHINLKTTSKFVQRSWIDKTKFASSWWNIC